MCLLVTPLCLLVTLMCLTVTLLCLLVTPRAGDFGGPRLVAAAQKPAFSTHPRQAHELLDSASDEGAPAADVVSEGAVRGETPWAVALARADGDVDHLFRLG